MPTLNINGNIRTNTAAGWGADATVYTAKTILVTTDATYGATDQRKFKIADGTQTWTQLDYFPVSGYDDATSSIQTQLNGKQASGSYLTSANITQVITNGVTDKAPSEDAVYDALALKQNTLTNPVTGTGTTNEITYFTAASTVASLPVATYPSLTELSYVKGVTSAIQTQLGAKTNGSICEYRVVGNTRWHCSAITAFAPGTQAITKDVIRLTPFVVESQITLDRIAIEVTIAGTAASVIRLGIYNSGSDNLPTTNLLNAGTVAGDSATNQTITISQVLSPGIYWLASTHNSAANITVRSIPFTSFGTPAVLGLIDGSFTSNQANQLAMTYTYDGTLPTISGPAYLGTNTPLVAVRLSA